MYENTLYPKTLTTLEKIQQTEIIKSFYLAGGTALALQLGHRKSNDLDFFSQKYPLQENLIKAISTYRPTIIQQATGTLDLLIDDVKVSFFNYDYPLIKPLIQYRDIKLASSLDIACMKIVAIAQRGTKKDFVDLYFILQNEKLSTIYTAFEKKYKNTKYQKLHVLKSLVYFDDANDDPEPDYLIPIKWENVKEYLEKQVL